MIGEVLPDIPRIYTALAEWSACIIFVMALKNRYDIIKTVLISILFLVIQSTFLVLTGNAQIYLWLPCMITAFTVMALFIGWACRIGRKRTLYFTIMAFVVAEFAASLEWQITRYFWRETMPQVYIQLLMIIFIYGVVDAIIYLIFTEHMPKDNWMDLTSKDIFSAAIIGIAVFSISNLSFLSENTPFSGKYSFEIANIRTLVDLGGIAMLYAHFMQCTQSRARQELEAVQNVLQNQYAQYKQSRESIELINYKYHDLKHQIYVLRSETDPEKRNEFLDKMEEEIKQYELQNKTGNKVLDTLLTSKSMYCQKHGITLTSVADGKLLDFMDVMDICSIFGNTLDNAIESSLKIPEKEKRLIHVSVTQQKNFLLIRIENYYEGNLKVSEGNLITSKKEKQFHGYGIKSVKYIVNKYNGAVNIDTKDNWFNIKILIPLAGYE